MERNGINIIIYFIMNFIIVSILFFPWPIYESKNCEIEKQKTFEFIITLRRERGGGEWLNVLFNPILDHYFIFKATFPKRKKKNKKQHKI